MLLEELFFEIGAIIVVAAALSLLVARFRLPLVIAYIITGIVAGPSMFALAHTTEMFEAMSKIGVAFLLFTVGLGLNWRSLKDVGGIALATGVGQVLFSAALGFAVGQLLGFEALTSLYLSVAFSFSSTIIIVKLLSDKDELDTLYGRISVGFLLVQDFIAIFLLLALSSLGTGATAAQIFSGTLFKVALLVPLCWIVSTMIAPKLIAYAARSQELLLVFSIGWCFFVAWALQKAGFTIEVGALIAGITLSGSVFEREILARIRSIRDFFLIIFFVVHGLELGLDSLTTYLVPAIVFSLFVLLGKPLAVMGVMRLLGYHSRTGFLSGTTVAQISEFSFIILVAGISFGHLPHSILALATLVGFITIACSSFLIQYNDALYAAVRPLFRWLEPKRTLAIERSAAHLASKSYLFGMHNIGAAALKALEEIRLPFVVVDFDPAVIRDLAEAGVPAVYGDASDDEFLGELGIHRAQFIISTIPEVSVSLALLGFLRNAGFKGTAIVSARTAAEAASCYAAGATYVIIPTMLGGEKLRELLTEKKTRRQSWARLAQAARQAAPIQ